MFTAGGRRASPPLGAPPRRRLMIPGRDLIDDIVDRPEWMRDAACREHDPRVCFPMLGESVEPARAICAQCLVRAECAAYADVQRSTAGVWAGMSARNRRRLHNPKINAETQSMTDSRGAHGP